jgi:hypothetical protein
VTSNTRDSHSYRTRTGHTGAHGHKTGTRKRHTIDLLPTNLTTIPNPMLHISPPATINLIVPAKFIHFVGGAAT